MRYLVAALLALSGCGRFTSSGPADAALTAFVPADTVLLAGVRVDDLKKTPLYQDVLPLLGPLSQGFDPRRDVQEILVASDGVNACAIARGQFPSQELARMARSEYKGLTLYGDGDASVALLENGIALAGITKAVRAAIDQQKSGRRAAADLLRKAAALPTPNQIWMVSKGAPTFLRLPQQVPNAAMLEKMLHAMSDLNFVSDFREGIYATFNGRCATEADAKFLGDTVRGIVGLARLSLPRGEAELTRAIDGVTVTQTRHDLAVNAKVPQQVAAQAMARLRSFSPGRSESRPRPR
jgi:hypothetical protein